MKAVSLAIARDGASGGVVRTVIVRLDLSNYAIAIFISYGYGSKIILSLGLGHLTFCHVKT